MLPERPGRGSFALLETAVSGGSGIKRLRVILYSHPWQHQIVTRVPRSPPVGELRHMLTSAVARGACTTTLIAE
jgi:hypothetical protein